MGFGDASGDCIGGLSNHRGGFSGAQREVEVLHDQLLACFSSDPSLRPRDVIVMVPDVNAYAPHIQAVFGQFTPGDPRFIPFTLADQGVRGKEPLVIALEHLLRLPESRLRDRAKASNQQLTD